MAAFKMNINYNRKDLFTFCDLPRFMYLVKHICDNTKNNPVWINTIATLSGSTSWLCWVTTWFGEEDKVEYPIIKINPNVQIKRDKELYTMNND